MQVQQTPERDQLWIEPVHLEEVGDWALPELQVVSSDAPDAMLKHYLRRAMREFTRRARVQIRYITLNLQECVDTYQVNLPQGEEFVSFQRGARYGESHAGGLTECGGYQLSWDVSSCNVKVHPEPRCAGPVRFKVATSPSVDSCLVDATLFRRYFDALLFGAKGYLYGTPGENVTWFNPTVAQYNELRFNNAITAAGIDKITGYSSGPFTIKSRKIV